MAKKVLNIDSYIEGLKAAQKKATAKKIAAEAVARKKKNDSGEAVKVQREANNRFQYADGLGRTLVDYEGQLKNYARKISRGDVLTPVEQADFDYSVKQYKAVSTAYTNALNEGNAILAKMPTTFAKEKADIQTKAGLQTDEQKKVEAAATPSLTEFLKTAIGNTEKTKQLQQALKDAGEYNGPIDGIFRADVLLPAATKAEIRLDQYAALGMPFTDRFEGYKRLQVTGGAGGAAGPVPYTTISNPTQARAYINNAYQGLLGRDATEAEIASLSKKLNNAELKSKTKTVKGVTTGGINREQFLTDIIKARPEYSKRKEDKKALTAETILSTARANGLTLGQDQINNYVARIDNGEDPKVIQNQIRQIAGNGMPDSVKKLLAEGTDLETIYAPYRGVMASVLEVNPDSIKLNDPVLRTAIGPDKEMPIYEFQRQLRKDARWQYTNNAREEVSNAALGVLRDFGFQG
jgi:hypothetical protein